MEKLYLGVKEIMRLNPTRCILFKIVKVKKKDITNDK